MTTPDPIEERARLRDELRTVAAASDVTSRRLSKLQRRIDNEIPQATRRIYTGRARGHVSEAEVQAFEAERAAVAKEYVELQERAEGEQNAKLAINAELGLLYQVHLDAFTDEAEEYTQAAIEKLLELRDHYVEATEAWAAAEAMWTPLAKPLRDEIARSTDADGMHYPEQKLAQLARLPRSPLPDAAKVFDSGLVPRPPGLTPTGDAAIPADDGVISVDLRTVQAS